MEELDEQGQKELEDLGDDADQDEVNAVFRRGQARVAQRRWPQRKAVAGDAGGGRQAKPPAQARAQADMTCPNCLEKGHDKDQCTKPKIAVEERKCFICKKAGHRAFQCPDKPRPVNGVEDEAGGRPRDTMCVEDEEGFLPIQRRQNKLHVGIPRLLGCEHGAACGCPAPRARRPAPMERRLADFMGSQNTFVALANPPGAYEKL